ncbi:hypothetical protein [[Clostridium] symbiosum]|uniref:hypothetical protein n=1 Tax=Clostridium symbiosum TaxID=1512 RepID=UPI00232D3C47|nr:hypothetical protein [[Clostridium] symbiosum]MBS6220232.1 hypothetical protein [[Clostridium] symbiosum]MDB2009638.1 hypothetical protein [[Clostridium] symbiosum]MDB2029401.1 hypothetical protein [[Clostridium] symbiosum]
MNNSMGSSPIFYENGSWYHRTKNLTEGLQIEYGKKGGYETEDKAAEAYVEHLSIFKNRLALLKEKQTPVLLTRSFRQMSLRSLIVHFHSPFLIMFCRMVLLNTVKCLIIMHCGVLF